MYVINVALYHVKFIYLMYEMHRLALVLYKESIIYCMFHLTTLLEYKTALLEYIDLLMC